MTVNFGEKVMNGPDDPPLDLSPFSSPFSPSSFLPLLHSNEKWVKAGIKTTEGCATIVLSMFLCQQEAIPKTKPGKNIVAAMVAITGTVCSPGKRVLEKGEASASAFPTRERRHAAYMNRNLQMKGKMCKRENNRISTLVQEALPEVHLLPGHDKVPPFK